MGKESPASALERIYESVRQNEQWDHIRKDGVRLVKGTGCTERPLAMIVGEAPGATENTHGKPFCGQSGRVLAGLMAQAGLGMGETFITYVVKYRLPGGRQPDALETEFGARYVNREWISLGRPPLLVAVGGIARRALIPGNPSDASPGTFVALGDGGTAPFVWVQYAPAYGVKHPEAQPLMEEQWELMGDWLHEQEIWKQRHAGG